MFRAHANQVVPLHGSNEIFFKFRDVSLNSDGKCLLRNVSAAVCEMEILGIVGDHESGKRELIQILSREKGTLYAPYSGTITSHTRASLTNTDTLPAHFTVYKIMTYHAKMKGIQDPWFEEMFDLFACDLGHLRDLCNLQFRTLSQFQKRMVMIACQFPRLHQTLILDDPFHNFSGTQSTAMVNILRAVANTGCRIILTFDNIRQTSLRKIDQLLVLVRGVPVYYASDWKQDLPLFTGQVLKLKHENHCFHLDQVRDHFTKMPPAQLTNDKRFISDFQKPIPVYYQRNDERNRFSYELFKTVLERLATQQCIRSEAVKAIFCLFIGIGVYQRHTDVAKYSQHYRLCMSFLFVHILLGISRSKDIYRETKIYAFEQKQRFYSPYLYAIAQTIFDVIFDVVSASLLSTSLFLVLAALHPGGLERIPLKFMLIWGGCMRLAVIFICQTICFRFHQKGFGSCIYIIAVVVGIQIAACGLLADIEYMSKTFQVLHFISFPSHAYHAALKLLEDHSHPTPSYVQHISKSHNLIHMSFNLWFLYMLRILSLTYHKNQNTRCNKMKILVLFTTIVSFGAMCSYAYMT